jgi:hypothetical protein
VYSSETFCVYLKSLPSKNKLAMGGVILGDFSGQLLTGILFDSNHSGPIDGKFDVVGYTLEAAKESYGEWSGLFQSKDGSVVVAADSFGYSPLYYTVIPQGKGTIDLLVANSIQCIAGELRNTGRHSNLSPEYVALLLGTEASFAHTAFSSTTLNPEIKLCEPGQGIYASADGWGIIDLYRDSGSTLSYDVLLDKGIDRAVLGLQRMGEISTEVAKIQLRLSGGKDSRAVLALSMVAGIDDKLSVYTVNPATASSSYASKVLKKDLTIANYLTERYSLSNSANIDMTKWSVAPDEHLARWQRFRSNYNFKYRPRSVAGTFDQPYIDLYGGGGETFRTFWSVFFENLVALKDVDWSPEQEAANARSVFRWLYPERNLEGALRRNAEEQFVSDLNLDHYQSFADAIDAHYTRFRNRGHFATARSSVESNVWTGLPLSQPEFVKASEFLSLDDRRDGRILFDIIERTESKLNRIEFESGLWPERFIASSEMDAATGSTKYNPPRNRQCVKWANFSKPQRSFDEVLWSRNFISQSIAELRELSELESCLTPSFCSAFESRCRTESAVELGRLVAKLQSLRDTVLGETAERRWVLAPDANGHLVSRALGEKNEIAVPRGFKRSSAPVVLSLLQRQIDDSTIEAFVEVKSGDPSELEYAFYFYQGDKRIQTNWYSDKLVQRCTLDSQDATSVSVVLFARVLGANNPCTIIDNRKNRK